MYAFQYCSNLEPECVDPKKACRIDDLPPWEHQTCREKVGNGESCLKDIDCSSNICDPINEFDTARNTYKRKCAAKRALYGFCSKSDQCEGYTDESGNIICGKLGEAEKTTRCCIKDTENDDGTNTKCAPRCYKTEDCNTDENEQCNGLNLPAYNDWGNIGQCDVAA